MSPPSSPSTYRLYLNLYNYITRNTLTQAKKNGREPYLFPQKKFISVHIYLMSVLYKITRQLSLVQPNAFTETVEFLERNLASMLMRYCCSMIGCYFFLEIIGSQNHITDRLLAAGNNYLCIEITSKLVQMIDCW